MIDSLLEMTGYEKVELSDEGKVVKTDPRIMLSCSAVAKGYAVDVIAQLLKKKGIRNFMVDIGGEVVVHGQNPQNGLWRIGLNKPIDDSLAVNQELQAVLQVTDLGMATSAIIATTTIKTERNMRIPSTRVPAIRYSTASCPPPPSPKIA